MQTTGLKVLIIEDRRENIVFLANNIFKPKGFNIITARDGETGLRKALEESPDLIIIDLNIPKISGLDILADLKDRGANTPTIITTLHGTEKTAVTAFQLGVKDYLTKPFQTDDIEKALARALGAPEQVTASAHDTEYIKTLEQKVKGLEQTVAQLEKTLKEQETKQDSLKTLEQKLAEKEKKLEQDLNETTHLNELLAEQKQLTTEARNSAKAMVQFVIAQHKETLRQKRETNKLIKQVATFSNGLTKLATRLDKQALQFGVVSPDVEKNNAHPN